MSRLAAVIDQPDNGLPDLVRDLGRLYLDQIALLTTRLDELDKRMAEEAKRSTVSARLQRMPGIGPITAMAIETFAPSMVAFRRGRDFAAWLGGLAWPGAAPVLQRGTAEAGANIKGRPA